MYYFQCVGQMRISNIDLLNFSYFSSVGAGHQPKTTDEPCSKISSIFLEYREHYVIMEQKYVG